LFAAALATLALAAFSMAPARATTTSYWRDVITYVSVAPATLGGCIKFQTLQTGGVVGVNNIATTGDTGAPGYTGGATMYAIGVGPGTGGSYTHQITGGGILMLLESSRLSANLTTPLTVNWVDEGGNSTAGPSSSVYYGDCPTSGIHAADAIGQ
jgi:hypothetical protein